MRLHNKILLLLVTFFCVSTVQAQAEKKPLIIELSYHVKNNQFPYLIVFTKTKEEKKFLPVSNMEVLVYVNNEMDALLLGKAKTDASGKALLTISSSFKSIWDSSSKFKFIATSPGNNIFENSTGEINITKAKIFVDTLAGAETKTLSASVMEQQNNTAVPAKDVELKIIVSRMAGNLSVGDAETYTTDSTGTATVEFKKDSIPGDKEGYITVIAKTEDNDNYGNISIEKKIKWGAPFIAENQFNKRTLFATRDKSPIWLLSLAYSIVLGVWATIIYLFIQIMKIRKMGLDKNTVTPAS